MKNGLSLFNNYSLLVLLFTSIVVLGCQQYKEIRKTEGQLNDSTMEEKSYLFENGVFSVDTSNPLKFNFLDTETFPKDNSVRRKVQSLNGVWQVEEGTWDKAPNNYAHQVAVPGLMDMATPAYEFPLIDPREFGINPEVEFAAPVRSQIPIIIDEQRDAFWYKRTFNYDGKNPGVAIIKINKAKYHTTVWLNGEKIGENPHNFAPGYFDVTKALKVNNQENELVVRVGASMSGYKGAGKYMDGYDVEKTRFYPGIYDDVELITSGNSNITRFQIAPDPALEKIKVAIWLNHKGKKPVNEALLLEIKDYENNIIKTLKTTPISLAAFEQKQVYLEIPFKNAKRWSPEAPNLYKLSIKTSNDEMESRFGMRAFHFDKKTKLPTLNGETRFLRGSNISFFRFAEDATRGDKAWNKEWVRRLFKKIKSMHWNVVRTSLGPPPEFWYQIADEEGVMIVDEAPIWSLFREINLQKDILVKEYTAQLQAHWNYPSIIFWDAQNETPLSPQTLEALKTVRGIDLSNRAWDNGWGLPNKENDPFEEHVYPHFSSMYTGETSLFDLNELKNLEYKVDLGFHDSIVGNPLIINEYGWLWLQRDGMPTELTAKGYKAHFPNATAADRFEFWNYRLAAITESMRARRVEGVMNFTALSHSFPGCYTSDNFIDLDNLNFEPHFLKYMKSAFAPVGLCIWDWTENVKPNTEKTIPIKIYNDDITNWSGKVRLQIIKQEQVYADIEKDVTSLGIAELQNLSLQLSFPNEEGNYLLVASLENETMEKVQSIRKIRIE